MSASISCKFVSKVAQVPPGPTLIPLGLWHMILVICESFGSCICGPTDILFSNVIVCGIFCGSSALYIGLVGSSSGGVTGLMMSLAAWQCVLLALEMETLKVKL